MPIAHALSSFRPPEQFDEYRLIKLLGSGGMGDVYLAHDTLLARPVAVKFIGAVEPDAAARTQFLVEARAAARVQHPNVLTIYRVGELMERPYIISEFVRGQSLESLPKPVPWRRALELAIGLSRGLGAAHRRGVLHRDIKPGNAIVTSTGDIKLLDFGLAKLIDSGTHDDPASWPDRLSAEHRPGRVTPVGGVRIGIDPRPIAVARASDPGGARALDDAEDKTLIAVTPPDMDGVDRPSPTRSYIAGTPLYLPPEIWRGEPATVRSDVYSLGAVLFELCAGTTPFATCSLQDLPRAVTGREPPPLRSVAPSVDPKLAEIIDRCLRRAPQERFASAEELRDALEQVQRSGTTAAVPEGNPYRGLLPFEAEHRALFFGRGGEIGMLMDRLRAEPFVLVAGDSGVGKSSLCRAGILPLVQDGGLEDRRTWQAVTFMPGIRPLAALAWALEPVLKIEAEDLADKLRAEPTSAGRELRARLGDDRGLLLFIDQLEELVTVGDPGEAALVGEVLAGLAVRLPGVRLLMTSRSDFLARVAEIPSLGDVLPRGLYFLRPMSPQQIREAIVGPARVKRVRFESEELVRVLVDSTASADGGLPLLQFALAELWEVRRDDTGPITSASLATIGGVAGALARHADYVLLGMTAEQHEAAREILIRLVTLEGTRARRTGAELSEGIETTATAALEALVRGRLVVSHGTGETTTFEVAHEALLKGWSTLREWLDEQADSRAVTHRLQHAATEWQRLERARDALWGARQLAEASVLNREKLPPLEVEFLAASERAMKWARRTTGVVVAGAAVALGLLYFGAKLNARREMDQQVAVHVNEALGRLATAHDNEKELEALRKSAFDAFDGGRRDEGEQMWRRVLPLFTTLDDEYRRAGQALETALTLDPRRTDVRRMLADILYARAIMAEQRHTLTLRDELSQRTAVYDTSGERARHFEAPAHVTIDSSPSGAHITLAQYSVDPQRRRALGQARDLGATPSNEMDLGPGSYLFTFELQGHVAVRYPVLLARGERLRVHADLPTEREVPANFVYVPAGRFLFGTSADEIMRTGFLSTVPIHAVESGAYLIARYETTYEDWIAYLRALPAEERASRAPRVQAGSVAATLALVELPGEDFKLTLQPATDTYSAKVGEMITYAARKSRRTQNWLRFPVAGISRDDAAAYAAWLDRSGRVPGARLCTEREWERAARGADDRELPTGDTLDPNDANFDEAYGKEPRARGPDEVGSHPESRSPFGLDDMAGNVFEWTLGSLESNETVIRGGGYFYGMVTCRSTNRTVMDPGLRDPGLGMRVCAAIPLPGTKQAAQEGPNQAPPKEAPPKETPPKEAAPKEAAPKEAPPQIPQKSPQKSPQPPPHERVEN